NTTSRDRSYTDAPASLESRNDPSARAVTRLSIKRLQDQCRQVQREPAAASCCYNCHHTSDHSPIRLVKFPRQFHSVELASLLCSGRSDLFVARLWIYPGRPDLEPHPEYRTDYGAQSH